MENRQQEWDQVREAARLYLEKPTSIPGAPSLKQYTGLLRMWVYPAFAERVAWHVFRRRVPGNETFLVRRITWDQRGDANRLLENPIQGLKEGFHPQPDRRVAGPPG